MELKTIGILHTPFVAPQGAPIQPAYAEGAEGSVEIAPAYADGLLDLDGFDRIWLVYWLHLEPQPRLRVVPFRDTLEHGIFATRSPCRPNPLGLSCVRLLAVEGRVLRIADVDMLDNTPLLDLKPYVPDFDAFQESRAGWFAAGRAPNTRADGRFAPKPL